MDDGLYCLKLSVLEDSLLVFADCLAPPEPTLQTEPKSKRPTRGSTVTCPNSQWLLAFLIGIVVLWPAPTFPARDNNAPGQAFADFLCRPLAFLSCMAGERYAAELRPKPRFLICSLVFFRQRCPIILVPRGARLRFRVAGWSMVLVAWHARPGYPALLLLR